MQLQIHSQLQIHGLPSLCICLCSLFWLRKERPQSVEVAVQRVLLRRGGANATLLALWTLQATATPTATPAANATEQAPVNALGATQHVDIRIEGEVHRHQDVRDHKERVRLVHAILAQRQRNGNLSGRGRCRERERKIRKWGALFSIRGLHSTLSCFLTICGIQHSTKEMLRKAISLANLISSGDVADVMVTLLLWWNCLGGGRLLPVLYAAW